MESITDYGDSTFLDHLHRLNLTPTPRGEKRRSRTQVTEQVVKKARLDVSAQQQQQQQQSSISASAAGCIQICEVDSTGRFVQIKNMSNTVRTISFVSCLLCVPIKTTFLSP